MPIVARPIRPEEVLAEKERVLPDAVFESFNTLITRNFNEGVSVVKQEDVLALMMEKGLTRETIFQNHWLDVEGIYRSSGWEVSYDKPGFSESYPATFTFRLK